MSSEVDPRARLKAWVRKQARLAGVLQWLLDPAFTPGHLIRRWVARQPGFVLNFGSGSRSLGAHVVNLDIEDSAHVHVVSACDRVPFADATFEGVLLEYVLEHVRDYQALLREVMRVLKPGGSVLVTVPFRQSYHACPQDFWRFTHEGLEALFAQLGAGSVRIEVYGGPISAWIDATKECLSAVLSFGSMWLYALWSQALIIPFVPLRYLDLVMRRLPTAKYTAFSFQAVAQKPGVLEPAAERVPIEDMIADALRVPEGYRLMRRGGGFWIRAESSAEQPVEAGVAGASCADASGGSR